MDYKNKHFLMFEIDELANQVEKNGDRKINRLTLGKSEMPLHQSILDAMTVALNDFSISSLVYPTGVPELKDKIVEWYKDKFGVDVSASNVVISDGTSTLFRNIFQIRLEAGDEVLIPRPYYSLYKFAAELVGARVKYYTISPNTGDIDLESFSREFNAKTKVVVINSPGNPLGNVIKESSVMKMDEIINGKALLVCDEIYANTNFEGANQTILSLNLKTEMIVTNSFSKAYRMYSRRVGFCIAPDSMIEPLTVIQHHTLLTADPVCQYGAIRALELQSEVEDLTRKYNERRVYTIKKLSGVKDIILIWPQGGFYFTIDCNAFMKREGYVSSFELAKDILFQKNVAVVPGEDFGIPKTIRLSFSSEKYCEGIDLLYDFFKEKQ